MGSTGEGPVRRVAPGDGHPEEDRRLLLRMAEGDETALGALYDRWSPLLYPFVLHIVGNADDAEELVEETFWQAWRQAERYEDSRGAVGTWLTMMARSRALDQVRARGRKREEPWETLGPEPSADGPTPLRETEAAEERALVRQALDRLPAEQREVLLMAYFGGLSQSEISERTGQPLGTVKTRMRLAMQKLREGLSVLREGAR
jgi:RNA polymerase sigma-70 factor (ECF subfamily)